ncbi:MAG: formylglycine-generating enzyme family protein [Chlorobium sp.]
MQFIDTYNLNLFAWADIFKHWQHRYFFSSVSSALWGERERLLQSHFPFVLPLSAEGMQVLAGDLLQTANTDSDWLNYWQKSADYSLLPVPTEGKQLEYIGLFFSTPLKRWIAACAVYPEINWNLTLALGEKLGQLYPDEHLVLNSYKQLSQLLRLDWFTKGKIPDAYRVDLIMQWLGRNEIASVCTFLYDQLSQNQPLPGEPDYENRRLQLDIYSLLGEPDEREYKRKAEQLSEVLGRQQRRPDMVSLHVINECDNCPVFFEVPDSVLLRWGIDPAKTRRARKVPPDFIRILAGEFPMGSPENEPERDGNDEAQHQVKVSEFYLCKHAVTLAEFKKFIDESGYQTDAEKANSSRIWDGKEWKDKEGINWRHGVSGNERMLDEYNHPVLHVSWNDAVAYCGWLSKKSGKKFRLPTEAEWEYACRAGTTTPFNTGENLTTDQANYDGNYPYNNNTKGQFRENTVPVDSLVPNAWGLCNMHGNVYEWCSDWYGQNYYDECKAKGIVENPAGPETGSRRVLRGGSWYNFARRCRSAYRNRDTPAYRFNYSGFRLAFVP